MVNVGIFYDHWEYFMSIWYNLWPFVIVFGHLSYFPRFGMFGPRKIWQPWLQRFDAVSHIVDHRIAASQWHIVEMPFPRFSFIVLTPTESSLGSHLRR
jgi:hypothetical protein